MTTTPERSHFSSWSTIYRARNQFPSKRHDSNSPLPTKEGHTTRAANDKRQRLWWMVWLWTVDRDIICNYRTNNKQQICVRRNLQFSTTSDSASCSGCMNGQYSSCSASLSPFLLFDSYTLHVQHSIHSDGSSYTQTLIATFKHCVENLYFSRLNHDKWWETFIWCIIVAACCMFRINEVVN